MSIPHAFSHSYANYLNPACVVRDRKEIMQQTARDLNRKISYKHNYCSEHIVWNQHIESLSIDRNNKTIAVATVVFSRN